MTSNEEKAVSRLAHVCAMLTSPNDGERAAAALLASRMVNELGMDWREFTRRAFRQPECISVEHDGDEECEPDLLQLCRELLKWDGLNDWERGFLESLSGRTAAELSKKQGACLNRIIHKYNAAH
jgi:hypothetical protein